MTDHTFSLDTIDKAIAHTATRLCHLPTAKCMYVGLFPADMPAETIASAMARAADGLGRFIAPIPFVEYWQLRHAGRTDLPRKLKKAARGFVPHRLRQRIERQAIAHIAGRGR